MKLNEEVKENLRNNCYGCVGIMLQHGDTGKGKEIKSECSVYKCKESQGDNQTEEGKSRCEGRKENLQDQIKS